MHSFGLITIGIIFAILSKTYLRCLINILLHLSLEPTRNETMDIDTKYSKVVIIKSSPSFSFGREPDRNYQIVHANRPNFFETINHAINILSDLNK